MSRIVLAAAITHGLVSVGHTVRFFPLLPDSPSLIPVQPEPDQDDDLTWKTGARSEHLRVAAVEIASVAAVRLRPRRVVPGQCVLRYCRYVTLGPRSMVDVSQRRLNGMDRVFCHLSSLFNALVLLSSSTINRPGLPALRFSPIDPYTHAAYESCRPLHVPAIAALTRDVDAHRPCHLRAHRGSLLG